MAAGSTSPSAPPPHEDSPPPTYNEVVQCPPDQEGHQHSFKTPVLLTGLMLSLVLVIILGCLVGDLWIRLDTLQVRVEHKNEKEMIMLKNELYALQTTVDDNDQFLKERIDHLTKRINGLQEAFKTGDAKHLVSNTQTNVLNVIAFLFCLLLRLFTV